MTAQAAEDMFKAAIANMRDAYNQHIKDLAEECARQLRAGDLGTGEAAREGLIEHLHETVDGDGWVNNTQFAKATLLVSGNAGAFVDNFGSDGLVNKGDLNWSGMAYAAVEQDVLEALGDLDIDVNDPNPEVEEDAA